MSHIRSLDATKVVANSQKQRQEELDRTETAFVSSLTAIAAINCIGQLFILMQCEGNGKHCYEADISWRDLAIATMWVITGGLIGQTIPCPLVLAM